MEFFYAKHLETEFESTENLIEECLTHVVLGSRTVPAHLALQIRTKDKRTASSKVCDALTVALEQNQSSPELDQFCLESLDYLLPDAASITELVAILAPRGLASEKPTEHIKLLCTANPLRNTILQSTLPAVYRITTVDEVRKLAPALYQLHREKRDLIEMDSGETVSIVRLIIDQTYSKQAISPFLCKLAFDLDAKTNWSALAKFGVRNWFNTRSFNILAIATDSQRMVEEAARKVADAEYNGGRYLKLARILSREIQEIDRKTSIDYYFALQVRYNYSSKPVNVALEPKRWRKDKSALEVFAFCLTLFLESNSERITRDDTTGLKKIFLNVVNMLEETKSQRAAWYRSWMEGEASLLFGRRYIKRRVRYFVEE